MRREVNNTPFLTKMEETPSKELSNAETAGSYLVPVI